MQHKNTTSRNNFSERLRTALRYSGLTHSALARRLGVNRSTVSRWNGNNLPAPEKLEQIAAELGVRREWLTAGLDPMLDESSRLTEPETGYRFTPRPAAPESLVRRLAHKLGPRGMWEIIRDALDNEATSGHPLPEESEGEFSWMLLSLARRHHLEFRENPTHS